MIVIKLKVWPFGPSFKVRSWKNVVFYYILIHLFIAWNIIQCLICSVGAFTRKCKNTYSICFLYSEYEIWISNFIQHIPQQSQAKFNSLWPSAVIWRQGSRSTLAQVMAWCLMAPSHYLNQFWLIISEALWHSPDSNWKKILQKFIVEMSLTFTNLKLLSNHPGAKELIQSYITRYCI